MASNTMYVCLHFFIERGDGQIEKYRRSAGPIELEFVQLPMCRHGCSINITSVPEIPVGM